MTGLKGVTRYRRRATIPTRMDAPTDQIVNRLALRRLPKPEKARRIRMDAGATQADLAKALGVNRVTVARWELGTRRPRGPLAEQYGELLRHLQEIAW